jgi:hypothetical protein
MKNYNKNLIDRMGGVLMMLVLGGIGLVIGMIIEFTK